MGVQSHVSFQAHPPRNTFLFETINKRNSDSKSNEIVDALWEISGSYLPLDGRQDQSALQYELSSDRCFLVLQKPEITEFEH